MGEQSCYSDGANKVIDLHSVKWSVTRKSSKLFLPFDNPSSVYLLKNIRSMMRQAKYVCSQDDLSSFPVLLVTTRPASSSQRVCRWIWRLDKINATLLSSSMASYFSIHEGTMSSVASSPTEFLGQIIGGSFASLRKLSSKILTTKLDEPLTRLDASKIRGNYKVCV